MKIDFALFIPMVLLVVFGLVAIYSLSEGGQDSLGNFNRQLIFVFLSFLVFLFGILTDYRIWRSYVGIFYIVSVFSLLLVFVIGKSTNGAVSWFRLGFFNFQPVEFVKIALILLLAKYFSQMKVERPTWKDIFISFLYVALPVVLVMLQPDMGSAMVLLAIWLGMIFLAGLNVRQVLVMLISGVVLGALFWSVGLHDYQRQRVIVFLNPGSDALGSGYNVIQAGIAIGSGGLTGKGLGHGSQSQLNFIPERHTDFIFATIAEETGLLGVFLILLFLGIVFYRLKIIMFKAGDIFGRLIVGGVMTLLFFHVLINVGMNLGIMPVAGLSLPLLSYGGSFLLTVMFLFGVVENIWIRQTGEGF